MKKPIFRVFVSYEIKSKKVVTRKVPLLVYFRYICSDI